MSIFTEVFNVFKRVLRPVVVNADRMGANLLPVGGATFKVWAPHAHRVQVIGTFNGWNENTAINLQPSKHHGCWETLVVSAKAGHEYKYILHTDAGKLYRNDPYAREVTNSVGNSIIVDTNFDWQGAEHFKMPSWNDLAIYELHIGTFNREENQHVGTFESAIRRLPFIKAMGFNAVEVMPPFEFAGDISWGYNPAHPFAIEQAYGGVNGFKTFIREAHKAGIAVILDVVYNHFGPSDMDLWQFDGWSENGKGGIYFYNDWRSSTPWGDTRPDYGRPEVRQYIFDNAMMWLTEYQCDGLRMDMVPYIRNVNADGNPGNDINDGRTLIQWINATIRHHFPHKITIAEDLHSRSDITLPTEQGGFGYGSQWSAGFVHPIRAVLTEVDDKSRDLNKVIGALTNKYNGDVFERIVYTESHDEVANGSARIVHEINGHDVDDYFAKKRGMLGGALIFTAPGIPMVFQGQTILEGGWFDDQVAINWDNLETYNGYARFFRDIIHLRRNFENKARGLQSQNIQILHANNESKVLVYHRYDQGGANDSVVVVLNFSNQHHEGYEFPLPQEGHWDIAINGNSSFYIHENTNADPHFSAHGTAAKANLTGYGILILTCH